VTSRAAYYARIRELALAKRTEFGVRKGVLGLREVNSIYRQEGITIDRLPLSPGLKAIYMCTDNICSVAIRKDLPDEPKLFALIHELKHHWADRNAMQAGRLSCGSYNENELIEKAAEVFAAEFIYPEEEFGQDIEAFKDAFNVTQLSADHLIHFKRNGCKAKVSYTYLRKRLEWLGLAVPGQFAGVKFQKREEELYGVPIYKQKWFVARRKLRPSRRKIG
jgi:Zn-dependent peptidase ImmA (M78 family)